MIAELTPDQHAQELCDKIWHSPKEALKYLLTHKISINYEDKYGKTPIYLAIEKNALALAYELYQLGAKIGDKSLDLINKKLCELIYKKDEYVKIEYLVKMGANVNYRDEYDKTPLSLAIDSQNEDVINLLHKNGVQINPDLSYIKNSNSHLESLSYPKVENKETIFVLNSFSGKEFDSPNYLLNINTLKNYFNVACNIGTQYPYALFFLKSAIANSNIGTINLILNIHGEVKETENQQQEYCLEINNSGYTAAKNVLKFFADNFPNKIFKIFVESCYGGAIHEYTNNLPKGSIIATTTNHDKPNSAYSSWSPKVLEILDKIYKIHNEQNSKLDIFDLLTVQSLCNSWQNQIPKFSMSGEEKIISLDQYLLKHDIPSNKLAKFESLLNKDAIEFIKNIQNLGFKEYLKQENMFAIDNTLSRKIDTTKTLVTEYQKYFTSKMSEAHFKQEHVQEVNFRETTIQQYTNSLLDTNNLKAIFGTIPANHEREMLEKAFNRTIDKYHSIYPGKNFSPQDFKIFTLAFQLNIIASTEELSTEQKLSMICSIREQDPNNTESLQELYQKTHFMNHIIESYEKYSGNVIREQAADNPYVIFSNVKEIFTQNENYYDIVLNYNNMQKFNVLMGMSSFLIHENGIDGSWL